jgi:hypothetical protein
MREVARSVAVAAMFDASATPSRSESESPLVSRQLEDVANLYRQGLLSDEEFVAAKARILGDSL